MKPHKLFILFIISFLLLNSAKVMAFDPKFDCGNIIDFKTKLINGKWLTEKSLQDYLNAYTIKGKWNDQDKYYALCFVPDNPFTEPIAMGLQISATADKPLIIYGLNLSPSSMTAATLLTLTGSNITLDYATLTGTGVSTMIQLNGTGHKIENSTLTNNGTGTAIQVKAPSPPPSPAGGEGVATIGPEITIENFEKGIVIKTGASAKITQNSIGVKSNLITDALNFETPIVSAFSENLIGKHLSEADSNYADKFVGKLAGKTVDTCVGNVEVIYKDKEGIGLQETPFNYLATCSLKWIKDDADKVTLKAKDGTTTDIGANSCIFECTNVTASMDYLVTFVYTDGNGVTNDYLASTPLVSELHVINVPGLPIYTPTTSGVTIETTEPTDPVAPPQEPANFDPSNPKGQTNDTNNSDGDGGPISAGTGGCSLIR